MKQLIFKHFTEKTRGKVFLWRNYFRVYADGGFPAFRWVPQIRRIHYDPEWEIYGFYICWLGRRFFFSFGKDKHGLYSGIR